MWAITHTRPINSPSFQSFIFPLNPQFHSKGFRFSIFTGRRKAPSIVAFAPKLDFFFFEQKRCNLYGGASDCSIGFSNARFLGSLSKFTRISSQAAMATPFNNGMPSVSVSSRSSRPVLLHWAAVLPPFSSRCITTVENTVESASQDSSASIPDVTPRIKFKRLDKTAKHIMQILDKEAVEEVRANREIPDIKPGYIVQLKVVVPENKRRVSVLKGIVIARRNAGLNTTFRLRRLVAGVGVESLFPLYSPNIKEIKVLDKKKVRRAKLYYLRDKMNALKKQYLLQKKEFSLLHFSSASSDLLFFFAQNPVIIRKGC
nr:50s ribosomal protein l19, chloroplastic [Quercus suber]